MKNIGRLPSSMNRLIPLRLLSLCVISVLVHGISNVHAANMGYGYLSLQAGRTSSEGLTTIGPSGGDLSSQLPYDLTLNWGPYGDTTYHASTTASLTFGPGIPEVGRITAEALAEATGYRGEVHATAGGSLRYYFDVIQVQTSPLGEINLPIYFGATGQGQINQGYGRITASASLTYGGNFPSDSYRFNYEGTPDSRSFSAYLPFDIPVGSNYLVMLAATAYAYSATNSSDNYATKTSEAFVNVDPVIVFDQEEFDRRYGPNSFRLSDYYSIQFSPNVPVPEPESYAMILAGLGLIGFIARRKKQPTS